MAVCFWVHELRGPAGARARLPICCARDGIHRSDLERKDLISQHRLLAGTAAPRLQERAEKDPLPRCEPAALLGARPFDRKAGEDERARKEQEHLPSVHDTLTRTARRRSSTNTFARTRTLYSTIDPRPFLVSAQEIGSNEAPLMICDEDSTTRRPQS